jgi:hypothetical protein
MKDRVLFNKIKLLNLMYLFPVKMGMFLSEGLKKLAAGSPSK